MQANPHFLAGLDATLDAEYAALDTELGAPPRRLPPPARRPFPSRRGPPGGVPARLPSRPSRPSLPSRGTGTSKALVAAGVLAQQQAGLQRMGVSPAASLQQQQAQARAAGGYVSRQAPASGSGSGVLTPGGSRFRPSTPPSAGLRPRIALPPRGSTTSAGSTVGGSTSAASGGGYAPYTQSQAPGAQTPGQQQGYPQQQQGYPQQQDSGYQQGYQQAAPQDSGYQPSSPQAQSYQQPSTPMGALDYYNEARKLRGMPPLPAEAGATDKEIANYLMQRMMGDEDRRPTFEETMYAILVLSAQAASRLGEAAAAQAMVQAAEQWKQVVLQNRAAAKQQAADQTQIRSFAPTPTRIPRQKTAESTEEEQNTEEAEDTGDMGWGDLGEGFKPTTRTLLTIVGAFGLAWGGLCLLKNRKKKA